MEEQPFASIEETEAEKIVVDETSEWAQDDIEEAEAALAMSDCHLRAQRRVVVHVIDVVGQSGIRVVEECAFQLLREAFG